MHVKVTALQLIIGQPGILTPKHQRHLRTLLRLLARRHATLTRIQQRPRDTPITRTGAEHQTATHQRLLERAYHLRRIEHIISARRPGHRVSAREILRINQHQLRQPHVLHGPRRATDIAWVTGVDQNNANIF